MRIHDIPYYLRNTVEHLDLPIYIELTPNLCRPYPSLALGDVLMVLGLIRNQGRPVTLCLDPGSTRELVEGHPLVREIVPPQGLPEGLQLTQLPVPRVGRGSTLTSQTTFRLTFPVVSVDQIRANPILAHSLYYKLEHCDDRPSVWVDPERPAVLSGLLSSSRPTLVLFPSNPGRDDFFWQDPEWWISLARELRPDFSLVAVGDRDYGELAEEVDACLSMDDPGSTLADLAWLLGRAQAFVGRDGGLSHLAAAVCPLSLVVWDSMASYRYWAGRSQFHVLFSNPYVFRYPQTCRMTLEDLQSQVIRVRLPDGQGGLREEELPREGYEQRAEELFGSVANLMSSLLAQREVDEERQGVRDWMRQPAWKERFYAESRAFAGQALRGALPQGAAWVVPVVP